MNKPISEAHCVDCMLWMQDVPDNFYDLSVCDPDFGLDEKISQGGTWAAKYKKGDGFLGGKPTAHYFKELFRVSKNQIIWGGNYFELPPNRHFIVWDKISHMPTMADCEMAWSSFDTNAKIFKHPRNTLDSRIHICQKPVALYKWIFQNYAKPGQKILDTHLGSQSSRIAAWDMGLDFYGCEIDKEYFEQGNARFETHKARPVLFPPDQMYFPAQQELFK